MKEVTHILTAIEAGDPQAAEELLPVVYGELRRLAAQKMAREQPDHTLQATALVHDAYLRLVGPDDRDWAGPGHFYRAAAEAMRRVLIENARRKRSLKRGGEWRRADLDVERVGSDGLAQDLLALDEALGLLEREDPVKAELVKLRYFAGLTKAEAAHTLGISVSTVDRYWAYAKAWLYTELQDDGSAGRRTHETKP